MTPFRGRGDLLAGGHILYGQAFARIITSAP